MAKKKKPNTRLDLFYSENEFALDISYGREYVGRDMKITVLIYQVNVIKSKTHFLYGESQAEDKKLFPPIEIIVNSLNLMKAEPYNMVEGGIVRDDLAGLSFSVYDSELIEKKCGIKRGDYVKYYDGKVDRVFEVTHANNVSDSSQTIGGFNSFFKQINAIPVKDDVINLD